MSEVAPLVIVLAGPNGAGKTTCARCLLAETLKLVTFVNADVIAQGLSGFSPETMAFQAGRIMLSRLHELAKQRTSFAFETTLSGRYYVGWLREAGYALDLVYCWLESSDLAVARVAARVRAGGHDIPSSTIRQRYQRSLASFFRYYHPLASSWKVFDNSSTAGPLLVAQGKEYETETVRDEMIWQGITRAGEHD